MKPRRPPVVDLRVSSDRANWQPSTWKIHYWPKYTKEQCRPLRLIRSRRYLLSPQAQDANVIQKLSKNRQWEGGVLSTVGFALLAYSNIGEFQDKRRILTVAGFGVAGVGATILLY